MEERRWEDLETDCLVNILGRVGMESLLMNVPLVCKSWYKASLNPLSWQHLHFPDIDHDDLMYYNSLSGQLTMNKCKILPDGSVLHLESFVGRLLRRYKMKRFSVTAFIKFIVNRSSKTATVVILPSSTTQEALKCPALKTLSLPSDAIYSQQILLPFLIRKWKNLQALMLQGSHNLIEIVSEISVHCKNFQVLSVEKSSITKAEAYALVKLLPQIKRLLFKGSYISRKGLMMILQGCKELTHLDVRNCLLGFEVDGEILELASHIQRFSYQRSRPYNSAHDFDEQFDRALVF